MNAMKAILTVAAACLFAASSAHGGELSGNQIREILTGNSIVSPDFGCVHYQPGGGTMSVDQAGNLNSGRWGVRGDLYTSSGRCGEAGCAVSGAYPDITFRSLDGDYVQPVVVIKGNFCEKNAVIS
jgi:hypothetical protein